MGLREWAADRLRKAADVVSTRDLSELAVSMNSVEPQIKVDPQRQAELRQAGMGGNWPMSPGQPMIPTYPGQLPRQFQYSVGQNSGIRPRSEQGSHVAFKTLRDMTRIYDVARMAINLRLEELSHLDFDIVARSKDDKTDYSSDIKQLRTFFEKPDGVTLLDRWLTMAGEDWLGIDALSIYRHRNRAGTKLVALEVVDGTTIKPLLDGRGRIPLPPTPGYEQWLWGAKVGEYNAQDLIYRPYWVRSDTPYGFPPMEWLLLNANTDVKTQWHFLNYFTQGNIPEGFGSVPETWSPEQIQEFQDYWDALMKGNTELKRDIRFVPGGFNFKEFRGQNFDDTLSLHLLQKTCAAYSVTPQELGFTMQVNKSSGEMQQNVQQRRSIKPAADFFQSIFDDVISTDFNKPHLRFKFMGLEETEDALKVAQTKQIYVNIGALSPDEVRTQDLGLAVDPGLKAGRIFVTASGPVPLDQVYMAPEVPEDPLATSTGGNPPDGASSTSSERSDAPDERPDDEGPPVDWTKAAQDDLAKWQKKAVQRLRSGKGASCKFESEHINPILQKAISYSLSSCGNIDEVRGLFEHYSSELRKSPRKRINPPKPSAAVTKETRALADTLQTYLAEKGPEVADFITTSTDPVAAVGEYDWSSWGDLGDKVAGHLQTLHALGGQAALKTLKAYGTWDLSNKTAIAYAQARGAELVGKRVLASGEIIDNPNPKWAISESTREWVKGVVTQGMEDGLSMDDLSELISSHYAFSDSRARTVSRTETGFAWNRGSVDAYKQTGLVSGVEVLDGDSDEECAEANGQIWTLEEAEANPLAHPNCVRGFAPIVDDTTN